MTKKYSKLSNRQPETYNMKWSPEPQGHTENMITSREWMALFMNDAKNAMMLFKQTVYTSWWLLT